MATLDWSGQIRGQEELPKEIVDQFRLPGRGWGKDWQLEPLHTVTILPMYKATGSRAPKAPKVHWHDWMREQTRPWRREPDRDIAWLLKRHKDTDGFAHEFIPEEVAA
jgi:hypothetical protein